MDTISNFISKQTIEKRKYLKEFFIILENLKKINSKLDVYNYSINDDYNFWNELYEDYVLIEKKPRIGKEHQVKI